MNSPEFPTVERLRPWLNQLEASPGGCVVLVIDYPEPQPNADVRWAFFDRDERTALRKAIEKINRARTKAGIPRTTQEPKGSQQ